MTSYNHIAYTSTKREGDTLRDIQTKTAKTMTNLDLIKDREEELLGDALRELKQDMSILDDDTIEDWASDQANEIAAGVESRIDDLSPGVGAGQEAWDTFVTGLELPIRTDATGNGRWHSLNQYIYDVVHRSKDRLIDEYEGIKGSESLIA